MIHRLPSTKLVRLIAALLLAVVGLHAAEPIRGVQQVHGSAFSAATYQVAITPQRRIEVAGMVAAPLPQAPSAAEPAGTPAPHLGQTAHPRPDSTGPPTFAILARQPAPRAPPLA